MMDFSEVKSTAQAAEALGVTPGKLLRICARFPSQAPQKVGVTFMWTAADIKALAPFIARLTDKCCPYCGRDPRGEPDADPTIDSKVAERQIEEREE